ncbi:MAG: A/G-specific adenine glycosylase [Sulfurovum sp.]|nr:A/G-specific adenine glycosylase [Sulfurovum sp.]MCB4760075.1 A/G-specific adenine glycosylase [Sulfurovum sp.]
MKQLHLKIREWYAQYGRHNLPWRTTNDPYHIYVSEIMLQQTQVKTVLERFYFPFLKKFPTLKILAKTPLDEILKVWEGLGYYNRAKNLHKTAQILLEKEGSRGTAPVLPSNINTLMKLPGIGKNTAHAIAAFAFGQPVPIMEANVRRILCRLYRIKVPNDKKIWDLAYNLVDTEHPFDYNQAMMDIGATLCLPKVPKCNQCPLISICQGKNSPEYYPIKVHKKIPNKEEHILLYRYNNTLSLTQRSGKFLHGLWGFGSIDSLPCNTKYLGDITHTYTHFKLTCHVYLYNEITPSRKHYFMVDEIKQLAISKVDEKIITLYKNSLSNT